MCDIIRTEEGEKILKSIEDLTPWDRLELVIHLAVKYMSEDDIYKTFIEDTDYDMPYRDYEPEYDSITDNELLDMVFSRGLERMFLEEISSDILVNFVNNNYKIELAKK